MFRLLRLLGDTSVERGFLAEPSGIMAAVRSHLRENAASRPELHERRLQGGFSGPRIGSRHRFRGDPMSAKAKEAAAFCVRSTGVAFILTVLALAAMLASQV
jgi:hypothetical protein